MNETRQSYLLGQNMYKYKLWKETKTSFRRTNNIKILSEWLGSLQITEKASDNYKQRDIEMSIALAAFNKNI